MERFSLLGGLYRSFECSMTIVERGGVGWLGTTRDV